VFVFSLAFPEEHDVVVVADVIEASQLLIPAETRVLPQEGKPVQKELRRIQAEKRNERSCSDCFITGRLVFQSSASTPHTP